VAEVAQEHSHMTVLRRCLEGSSALWAADGVYSLGFYVSRAFTLVTSVLVLALLLREMMKAFVSEFL